MTRPQHSRRRTVFAYVCISTFLSLTAAAQTPAANAAADFQELPTLRSTAPVIDARLDDPAWKDARRVSASSVSEAGALTPVATEALAIVGNEVLYVAVICHDTQAAVAAADDDFQQNDYVAVELRAVERRLPWYFIVNTRGAQRASMGGGGEWNGTWDAAAALTTDGWIAEMAVPLDVLDLDPNDPAMAASVARYHARTGEWTRVDLQAAGAQATQEITAAPGVASAAPVSAPPALPPPAAGPTSVPRTPTTPATAAPPASAPRVEPALPTLAPSTEYVWQQGVSGQVREVPSTNPSAGRVQLTAMTSERDAYILQPGDTVDIKLFNNPELNESLPIRPDGRISLALLGDVDAANLTPGQLQARLAQAYARVLRRPDVAVVVKDFGGNKVYIGGEVNAPGIQRTMGNLTVLQALMASGGFKPGAEIKKIVILRGRGTSRPVFLSVNVWEILERQGRAEDPILKPYDIVFVPKTGLAKMSETLNFAIPPQILYAFGIAVR